MPPTIILIRHGQAEHNSTRNYDLADPDLTAEGTAQCHRLHARLSTLPVANNISAIIASPLRRTIQTTQLGLAWLIDRGVPIELDPLWQENSDKPCDTGSPPTSLAPLFPTLDFSRLDPVFPSKAPGTRYAFTREAVMARGQECLRRLHTRPEKVLAVVSHSAFLRIAVSRKRYANADFRVFTFAPTAEGEALRLEEDESTVGEGGMGESEGHEVVDEPWEFPL